MLIDWFTVGAQALNFLILVGLLRRFLYKPVLRAIDAREKRIAEELADAAAKEAEAKKEQGDFQRKNEELERQREALLQEAMEEAKVERKRLLDEARKAADTLSAKRAEKLENDAEALGRALRSRAQEEVFAIARKALSDLAATNLEERMCEVLTRRLREMDGPPKEAFARALQAASYLAVVRSAFDLPQDQRAVLQNAVNETFSADTHLQFETSPNLVSGIELTAEGQRVAWSIGDYLTSLEKGVRELLTAQGKPEAAPGASREKKAAA